MLSPWLIVLIGLVVEQEPAVLEPAAMLEEVEVSCFACLAAHKVQPME